MRKLNLDMHMCGGLLHIMELALLILVDKCYLKDKLSSIVYLFGHLQIVSRLECSSVTPDQHHLCDTPTHSWTLFIQTIQIQLSVP